MLAAPTRMPGGKASDTNRHRRISRPGSFRSTLSTICRPSARSRCRAADTRRLTPRREASSHSSGEFLDVPIDVVVNHSSRARLNGTSMDAGRSIRSFRCTSARSRTCDSMSAHATLVFGAKNRTGTRRSAASASAYNRSRSAFVSIVTIPARAHFTRNFFRRVSTKGILLCTHQSIVSQAPRQYSRLASRSPHSLRDGLLLPPPR